MEAKRAELLFNFLLLPIDILMVILSFVGAYYLRTAGEIMPVVYIWSLFEYLKFQIANESIFRCYCHPG